jgi:hypothetical protein
VSTVGRPDFASDEEEQQDSQHLGSDSDSLENDASCEGKLWEGAEAEVCDAMNETALAIKQEVAVEKKMRERAQRKEARRMRRAREELWWILEATAADVLRDDWLRHTSPFWMAIALEDADKPLVQRQRGAVKELLALEKARWGRELRVLRDKLQAALLEYDKEMLAHEMAEIRREERRARAVTSTKPNISTKTRRAKAYKVHCDDDEDLRPFDAPCVEMYLRRRSRSRSKSQERCSQERARLWAERRSAEADQLEREDGGDEMMSRLVEAVEPAMFRTLLLQNLICKLRQVSTQACFCVLQYSGLEICMH